jgi:hypothetical protein
MRHYWLTAGAATLFGAIITLIITFESSGSSNSPDQASYSGGWPMQQGTGVPIGFQGQWRGELSPPDPYYETLQVELELHSGGFNQIVGQMNVEPTACMFTVYLAGSSGTALTLDLVATDSYNCVPQSSAKVEQLDTNSLRVTRTGGVASPRVGVFNRVG